MSPMSLSCLTSVLFCGQTGSNSTVVECSVGLMQPFFHSLKDLGPHFYNHCENGEIGLCQNIKKKDLWSHVYSHLQVVFPLYTLHAALYTPTFSLTWSIQTTSWKCCSSSGSASTVSYCRDGSVYSYSQTIRTKAFLWYQDFMWKWNFYRSPQLVY